MTAPGPNMQWRSWLELLIKEGWMARERPTPMPTPRLMISWDIEREPDLWVRMPRWLSRIWLRRARRRAQSNSGEQR